MAQMVFKRYEIKYQLTDEQYERLLQAMEGHMVPDAYGPSTVRNIYYDTPSHLLARRSAEHPFYKEKLRIRSYASVAEDDDVFLELKKKCDGVVYKRRCTLPMSQADALLRGERAPQTQIEREIAYAASRYEGLAPAMFVAYDREAYYAWDDHEFRMTFDQAVRCRWDEIGLAGSTEGHLLTPSNRHLLEVKCATGMPLWLVEFLSIEGIFKQSFSKYGAAVVAQTEAERQRALPRHLLVPRRPSHVGEVSQLGRRLAGAPVATLS